ncbi:MAG: hypothetical protein K0Q72_1792 [Armatimonadetes bacterium]|jgi:hypothetical protein|nr:hypothetical protein [Armatimonadota bacterium]
MRLNLLLGLAIVALFCGKGCGQDDDGPGPTPDCITQGCDQNLPRVAAQAPPLSVSGLARFGRHE